MKCPKEIKNDILKRINKIEKLSNAIGNLQTTVKELEQQLHKEMDELSPLTQKWDIHA